MAKAREIEISADEPFADVAQRVVRVRAQEVFDHAEGVLDTEDIERVHAMRVATRRLRAVLEIFAPAFPAKAHRGLLREVKRLADALGERRDPDVHIVAIDRMLETALPEHRPGLQRLRHEWVHRQALGNRVLERALAEMETNDLEARLLALRAEEATHPDLVRGEVVIDDGDGAEPRKPPNYPWDDTAPGVRWLEH